GRQRDRATAYSGRRDRPRFRCRDGLDPASPAERARDQRSAWQNVVAQLPDGQPVRAITGANINGFIEIETSLSGAHLRGFASAQFLKPAPADTQVPIVTPEATPPIPGIVAVTMPRRPGTVAKRPALADAR